VLMALIEANGAVVSNDELMSRVWPGRIVEEHNPHVQIKVLRKAFSDRDLIRTVVGRGYQFTGEIRARLAGRGERAEPVTARDVSGSARAPTNLPAQTSDLIGRDGEIEEVIGLAADHRFVTLTGTGGIGKTRLALSCAAANYPNLLTGSGSPNSRRCPIPSCPGHRRRGAGARTDTWRCHTQKDRSGAPLKASHAGARQLRACDRCRRRSG
jgi:Transcriptional regulatory protein, C terminal